MEWCAPTINISGQRAAIFLVLARKQKRENYSRDTLRVLTFTFIFPKNKLYIIF